MESEVHTTKTILSPQTWSPKEKGNIQRGNAQNLVGTGIVLGSWDPNTYVPWRSCHSYLLLLLLVHSETTAALAYLSSAGTSCPFCWLNMHLVTQEWLTGVQQLIMLLLDHLNCQILEGRWPTVASLLVESVCGLTSPTRAFLLTMMQQEGPLTCSWRYSHCQGKPPW